MTIEKLSDKYGLSQRTIARAKAGDYGAGGILLYDIMRENYDVPTIEATFLKQVSFLEKRITQDVEKLANLKKRK